MSYEQENSIDRPRTPFQVQLLEALQANDEALQELTTTTIELFPRAIGGYSVADVRHILTGQLYLATAEMGLMAFNTAGLRTLFRNIKAMEQAIEPFSRDIPEQDALKPTLIELREEFLTHPQSDQITTRLLTTERHIINPVQQVVAGRIGEAALAAGQGRPSDDSVSLGFRLASEKGMADQLLAFQGKLGIGRYWDVKAYKTWFQSILKSNFPTVFTQLTWEDMGVPPAHYGIWSMGMSVDIADVTSHIKMNTDGEPSLPVSLTLATRTPDHTVLLTAFRTMQAQYADLIAGVNEQNETKPKKDTSRGLFLP